MTVPSDYDFIGNTITESQFKNALTILLNHIRQMSLDLVEAQGGNYSYATMALFDVDKINVPANSTVRIAQGDDAGLYVWDGTNLTKVETSDNPYLISSSPDNLFVISDYDGNELLTVGKDGIIRGNFDTSKMDLKIETSAEFWGDELLYIRDPENNVLASLSRQGEWFFPTIITNRLVAPDFSNSESNESGVTDLNEITIPESKYLRIDFLMTEAPPNDTGQTTVMGECKISDPSNSICYAHVNMGLTVQGHGSAGDYKKNFTLDTYNSAGDSVNIKIGDMIAVDSFHLKGFYRDPSHMRDQGGYRLWSSLVKKLDYPYSKVNNIVYTMNNARKEDADFTVDAKYYPHGFPVEVYLNSEFYGLYTLRLKKNRKNYALDNSNLSHIFLDSANWEAYLSESFDPADWEIKSPKMSGYVDQGAIPTKFKAVETSINRLFDFTKNLSTSYANHASVLNLPHWLLFYIVAEIIGDFDHGGNNYNIFTWDNTHWTIIPYDLDWTLNWHNQNNGAAQSDYQLTRDIWVTFRTVYLAEIKAMYSKFRNNKDITVEKIVEHYLNTAKYIPRSIYSADKEKWGIAPDFSAANYPNLEQVYLYINARINFLDSVWLNK